MNEFEVNGLWWIPQFPDHRVAGNLKFHPRNGAVLETLGDDFQQQIFGLFGGPSRLFGGKMTTLPNTIVLDIICGYTQNGDAVTLCGCQKRGYNWAVGYVGQQFDVQVVMVGCHFDNLKDLVFERIAISYTHVDQWLGISGFSGGFLISETGGYLDGELKYKFPERIECNIADTAISFYHRMDFASDHISYVNLKEITFLEIVPSAPLH